MNGAPADEGRAAAPRLIGRYALDRVFASGGMAQVHFGRLHGDVGFTRVVAIKRLHPNFARDSEFAAMLLEEAKLTAHIHHPNAAGMLDVVATDDELFLVMEYIRGESLRDLVSLAKSAGETVPPAHAVAILVGALHGLHAAHEARDASGTSLDIVHRDVSPQNILVGEDGVARIIDFGIAKAVERVRHTETGRVRGKIGYMAPEQLEQQPVDRRADIYAASVVLWELLTARPYIEGDHPAARMRHVLRREAERPSTIAPSSPPELDEILLTGLAKDPRARFVSALEMAAALEGAIHLSTQREVGAWVSRVAEKTLRERANTLIEVQSADASTPPTLSEPPRAPSIPSAPNVSSTPSVSSVPSVPSVAFVDRTSVIPSRLDTRGKRPARTGWIAALLALASVSTIVWVAMHRASSTNAQTQTAVSPPIQGTSPLASESPSPILSSSLPTLSTSPAHADSATPARTPARKSSKDGCKPPYTLDHGIKVPKIECL